jgi:hypothetical protein
MIVDSHPDCRIVGHGDTGRSKHRVRAGHRQADPGFYWVTTLTTVRTYRGATTR